MFMQEVEAQRLVKSPVAQQQLLTWLHEQFSGWLGICHKLVIVIFARKCRASASGARQALAHSGCDAWAALLSCLLNDAAAAQ